MPEADSNPHLAQVQYTLAVLHAESGQAEAAVVTARQALASAAAQPASQLTPLCLALVSMLLSAR